MALIAVKNLLQETDAEGEPLAEYTFTNHQWGNLVSEFREEGRFPLPDAPGHLPLRASAKRHA